MTRHIFMSPIQITQTPSETTYLYVIAKATSFSRFRDSAKFRGICSCLQNFHFTADSAKSIFDVATRSINVDWQMLTPIEAFCLILNVETETMVLYIHRGPYILTRFQPLATRNHGNQFRLNLARIQFGHSKMLSKNFKFLSLLLIEI